MQYMISLFGGMDTSNRSPEWFKGFQSLMQQMDTELKDAGEVVASYGLADASEAKTVRFIDGATVATDGPFVEVGSLAGFWVVDVTEERAFEIASRVVEYTEHPMEVRKVMHG